MFRFEIHWLPVFALALANFVVGALWYSVLFVKPWVKALKIKPEQMKSKDAQERMPYLMGSAALSAVVMSFGSLVAVGSLGMGDPVSGATVGLFIALAFVCAHASGSLFERRPLVVYGIACLHAVVVFTLDCSVFAVWR